MKSRKYFALDGIRGLALLNMTAYHAVWDLVCLFGFNLQWYQSESAYIWQQCICWTFIAQHPEKCSSGAFCRIFLSGFCEPLGKEKLKRGITVFSLGFLIVAATLITMPQNRVRFGVLTYNIKPCFFHSFQPHYGKKSPTLRRRTILSTQPLIYRILVSGKLSTRPFIYHISVSGKLSLYQHSNKHKEKSQ